MNIETVCAHILGVLSDYDATAQDIRIVLKEKGINLTAKQINRALYSMKGKQVHSHEYEGNKPVWTTEESRWETDDTSAEEERTRYLYVDLDHHNSDSAASYVNSFRGECFGFCKYDMHAGSKFPDMKIYTPQWDCKDSTAFLMYMHAYELIRGAQPKSIELWILSNNKSMENVVNLARLQKQSATLINSPKKLVDSVSEQTQTEDEHLPLGFRIGKKLQ